MQVADDALTFTPVANAFTQNAALHNLEFADFIASRASASIASKTSSRIISARGCSISVITYTVTER